MDDTPAMRARSARRVNWASDVRDPPPSRLIPKRRSGSTAAAGGGGGGGYGDGLGGDWGGHNNPYEQQSPFNWKVFLTVFVVLSIVGPLRPVLKYVLQQLVFGGSGGEDDSVGDEYYE